MRLAKMRNASSTMRRLAKRIESGAGRDGDEVVEESWVDRGEIRFERSASLVVLRT